MKKLLLSFLIINFNICAYNFENEKPPGITETKWNSLKSVIQQAKFMQNDHVGINGKDSSFGTSLAIEGNRALIGAPGTNNHGVVYVFEHDGNSWNETTYLEIPSIIAGANFGQSVGLSGEMALVGVPNDDEYGSDSGSVYVFELSQGTWSYIDQFAGGNTTSLDRFGSSIAVDSGTLIIGAIGADRTGSGGTVFNTGAVYIFEYEFGSWDQAAILTGFDTNSGNQFGFSVSLYEDWILVGNSVGTSAYIFKNILGVWDIGEKLDPSTNAYGFGNSVSVSDGVALIGAWYDNPSGNNFAEGSAFVFEYNGFTWEQSAQLRAADGDANYLFGKFVSLQADKALVGATEGINPNNNKNTGSVYLFELTGDSWSQTSSFYSLNGNYGDQFGNAIAFWDNGIFIASYEEDSNGRDAGAVFNYEKPASIWLQKQKLLAKSGAVNQNFASSLSISGNRAIIGAEGDTENGVDSGAAYVFEYESGVWNFITKLLPDDSTSDLKFGHAVSLDGDRVLISSLSIIYNYGIPFSYGGSAYIFDYANGNWNQTTKLTVVDNDFYGESVSLLSDRAIIGDLGHTINGDYSGQVFVYDLINGNWIESAQLISSDGFAGGEFGKSLSLSNNRFLIAEGRRINGYGGAAYIFDYVNGVWIETAKLLPADGIGDGREVFGVSVSLSEERALVGASKAFNNNTGFNAGAAYLYEKTGNNWNQVSKLYSSDGEEEDLFGQSVYLLGDKALIGAPGDNDNGTDSGSALTYENISNSWIQTNKLLANNGEVGDNFGFSVSLNNGHSLIGANLVDSEYGFDSGAGYVFKEDIIFSNDFE